MASLVALGAFLFLDLEKKKEPLLWDVKLETIKYGGITFEKQRSFKGDHYYTSFSHSGKNYRYRASTTVPNIFRELEALKMQGLYVFEGKIKERFPDDPFSDSEATRCVDLIPVSEDAFKLCALKEDSGGKVFAVTNRPQNQGDAYLIAKYTLDRLESDRTSFLERRVFLYPTATSTVEMEVILKDNLQSPEGRDSTEIKESSEVAQSGKAEESGQREPYTVHLFRKEKKEEDRTMMVWKDSNGREISPQYSNPLDTVLRQYQIKFFSFEYGVKPEELWPDAIPVLEARMVAGQDGKEEKTMSVEVRRTKEPLMIQDTEVLLMQSTETEGVQVLERSTVERTIGYIEGLRKQPVQPTNPPGHSDPGSDSHEGHSH